MSQNQYAKINNQFKMACDELDALKGNLETSTNANRRIPELENQVALLSQELERVNMLMEKRNAEIRRLSTEAEEQQDNIRLSTAQNAKLNGEIHELRNRFGETTQETEGHRQRIQRLLGENASLNDEVRNAQENLRLSAGQITKLTSEIKDILNENDRLKAKLTEVETILKKMHAEYQNKIRILTQEC